MNLPSWLSFGKKKQVPPTAVSTPVASVPPLSQRPRKPLWEGRGDGLTPEQRLKFGMQPRMKLRDFSKGYYSLAQNLVSKWIDAVNDRRSYLQTVNEISRYYITETIIETMAEDALCRDPRGNVMEFESEDENIKKHLDKLKKDHDMDSLCVDIVDDLIKLGELTLRIEANETGVTTIADDLNQIGIVAMYERGLPSNFLVLMDGEYKVMPASEYAHFVLGGSKERIRLDDAIDPDYQINMDKVSPEIKKLLPDYVRVGRPMFLKVVSKLRELQIMEQVLVAIKLNQILQSHLVGVRVPATSTVSEVDDILRDMEEILNDQVGIDMTTGQVTIAEIMTQAGRHKAFPLYSDEKGAIEAINARADVNVDDLLHSIDFYRKAILSSIGVPDTLIFGEIGSVGKSGEASRSNEIRRYGRYARKLGAIQWALAKGLKQIAMIHLNSQGIDASADSFDVVFKNSMIDTSVLEKMELEDAQQEMVLRKVDFLDKVLGNEILRPRIDVEGCVTWISEQCNILTGGIALFTGIDLEDDEEEAEFNDLRDRFLNVTANRFLQNRLARAQGDPVVPGEDPDLDTPDGQEFDKARFMQVVGDKFQQNRAARKEVMDEREAICEAAEAMEDFMDRVKLTAERRRQRKLAQMKAKDKIVFDEMKKLKEQNEKLQESNGNGNGRIFF